MLQVKVIAVGRIKEKYLKDGINEYLKRLGSYLKLSILEIEDEPCPERASAIEEDKIRTKEGERILRAISPTEFVVVLDLRGKELSSPELAALLEDKALNGPGNVTFVIGGSIGLAEEVRRRANFIWAWSRLTFPHQLIRLVLYEQLYRACKINKNETYHK